MKRWSLFIISLVLIYICVGCGKAESDTENPSQQDPSQTDTDPKIREVQKMKKQIMS